MARIRRVDPARDLLDLLAAHSQDASRQVLPQLDTGEVILVNDGTDGTVVQLDNMSVAASDCLLVGGYVPVVGDRVMVLIHSEEFWIIGGIQGQSTGTSTASPSGAAGGDLSGTYPNPTLSAPVATRLHQTGMMVMWGTGAAPSGWLLCDGSTTSRAGASAALFALWGTTYGTGDGSTTFHLPDFRGRAPIGAGTGDATDATAHALADKLGTETHTLTLAQLASHDHSPTANGLTGSTTPGVTGGPSVASTGAGTSHTHTFTGTAHGHNLTSGQLFTGGTPANPTDRIAAGGTGAGASGVPESTSAIANATAGGTNAGEAAHTHSMQSHTHTSAAHTHALTAQGGGTAHPNVQPSLTINFIVKL